MNAFREWRNYNKKYGFYLGYLNTLRDFPLISVIFFYLYMMFAFLLLSLLLIFHLDFDFGYSTYFSVLKYIIIVPIIILGIQFYYFYHLAFIVIETQWYLLFSIFSKRIMNSRRKLNKEIDDYLRVAKGENA